MNYNLKNPDLISPGETATTEDIYLRCCGKVLNQVASASKLCKNIKIVSCIGFDDVGQHAFNTLKTSFAETHMTFRVIDKLRGPSYVMAKKNGLNNIIVNYGATAGLKNNQA